MSQNEKMKCSVCGSRRQRNIVCTKTGLFGITGRCIFRPDFKCIRCWLQFIEPSEVTTYRYRPGDKIEVSAMRFCIYELMKMSPHYFAGYPVVEGLRDLLIGWYDARIQSKRHSL